MSNTELAGFRLWFFFCKSSDQMLPYSFCALQTKLPTATYNSSEFLFIICCHQILQHHHHRNKASMCQFDPVFRYRCTIHAPIFPSPTPLSLRSILQVFGFPYSVFPCLCLFHDTPTIPVKHPQCIKYPV
jgi:hypothetical protein